MTQRPPPPPDLAGYRPFQERHAGTPPPIEHRFGPPLPGPRGPISGRPPAKPPRKRRGWLRGLAWTLGGLAVLTGGAVAALVAFAPVGILREQLIREVHVRTGRDLVIAGPTSISIWPTLAVSMGDASVSTPPGMGGAPFVKMRRLDASVRLAPLLSRRLEIDEVVLTAPVFELRIDGKGRRSWEFAALSTTPTVQYAQAPRGKDAGPQVLPPELEEFIRNSSQGPSAPPADQPSGGRSSASRDIALGALRVLDGTVRYRDERSGASEEIRALNLRVSAKSLASPMDAKGDLTLRGDRLDFDLRIASPKALMEERSSRIALTLASPRVTGRYDGALNFAKGSQIDGAVKLETRSIRSLAQWIGANMPDVPGLGALSLDSDIKTGPSWLALTGAKARLAALDLTGNLNLDLVSGRPTIKANLRLGALDLNAFLQPQDTTPAGQAGPAAPPGQAGPQVRGFTQRSGWSEAPIDLSALGLFDAEARIAWSSLAYQDVKLGAAQLNLNVKNRALRVNLDELKLYDGQGKGVVTLDGNAKTPSVVATLALDGVSGLPFLRDTAGFDWIDGKAKVQLALGGQGTSEKAIVESLNGKAEFAFTDGAIVGYDIQKLIGGISLRRLPSFNRVPTERTAFTTAAGSFVIRNGIAETKDLRALSQHVQITGAGSANLAQRQIDMTLRPKLAGASAGGVELSGLELPFRIRGSWERPQIGADLDAVLKNPGQAMDSLRELGKQIQQGKAAPAVKNLLDQFLKR